MSSHTADTSFPSISTTTSAPGATDAPSRAGERARTLYGARTHPCSGAVLAALNQELDGGLSEEQAASLAAGFGHAMGGSGCLCGAISGAVLGLGLFLAPQGGTAVRKASARLHETFRAVNGSTCCRVLCKRAPDKDARRARCAVLSAGAAEAAARIILETRPDLTHGADAATGGSVPPAP
ncbi:MAG: C_GCAxxG_C_C family protein [Desulfovibrionaceae bacterium]|jgi:C_GCAxxG_C_C family probable redox protein|nr:C_GCAxxG_C_C family protein [Desulfovibrionaceae bacterium]